MRDRSDVTLLDTLSGERLELEHCMLALGAKPGLLVSGTVFESEPGRWALSMADPLPDIPNAEVQEHLADTEMDEVALKLESLVHGATTDWTTELTESDEVKALWTDFGESLNAGLPSWDELEREIQAASEPGEVLKALGARVEWWTTAEIQVMAALVAQAWNLTPRAKLDGRTPRETGAAVRAHAEIPPVH